MRWERAKRRTELGDICTCAILKSGLRPFAIPQNGFSKMPVSNVNQLLQCLFLILLPILQFNQPELTKIPLGAGPLGSQTRPFQPPPSRQGK
jgi:hypothetical protein